MHAVSMTIFAFENRSYHGELETEFKKAQGVMFDEKSRGSKIS
jgi:hypothetical protein